VPSAQNQSAQNLNRDTTLYQYQNNYQKSIAANRDLNQLLDTMQKETIFCYVNNQYVVGLSCSNTIVYNAICYLYNQDTPSQLHPSIGYIKNLIKSLSELYKIKYKLLDYKCRAVQDVEAVQE
jgi:hypothetical protein